MAIEAISSERRAAVDAARETWIRRLIDLSRRNTLLFHRELKTGMLDFTAADPGAMAALFAGEGVRLTKLLPAQDEAIIASRAQQIRRRALTNLEERGLETLFLALGMAKWPAADGGRPYEAPVLLAPVAIEARGRESAAVVLKRAGEVQLNLVLLHILETGFGCAVDADDLLGSADSQEDAFDPEPVFSRLRHTCMSIKNFEITPRAILGNFSFQKMAMVKELRECGEALAAHDVIAAIAGDSVAREAVCGTYEQIDAHTFDNIPPEQEFLILDADSSQERVVAAVNRNQHAVIHGPPGTGKSQTITNLIATLAAGGKRILFVAEKRAALEVVFRRLQEVGLGHLALDLHGAEVTRRQVVQRLAESLEIVREAFPVPAEEIHRQFVDRRSRLNRHVQRLHAPRPPSGLSVYELQGRLLRLPPHIKARVRWRGSDLEKLTGNNARAIGDLLVEATGFAGLFLRSDPSPWTGAHLPDGATAQRAVDLVGELLTSRIPALLSCCEAIAGTCQLLVPRTVEDADEILTLLTDTARTLTTYCDDLFDRDIGALATAMRPGQRGRLAAAWAFCTNASYRAARRTLRALRQQKAASTTLAREAAAAAEQVRRWRLRSQGPIRVPEPHQLAQTRDHLDALRRDVTVLRSFLAHFPDAGSFEDLENVLNQLASDAGTAQRLPRLIQIENEIAERGAGTLLNELRQHQTDASLWMKLFEHAWLSSCLDRARAEDPDLAAFNGATHQQFAEAFQRLDRQRLELARARGRRAHAEHVTAAMNAHPEQAALLRREAQKKSRHLPIRKLLAQAPDVVTALCPCWMASPLSVSQLLGADRRYFDVVMFDEASQIPPEDAIPSLLRASRAVVAGDSHQLPPTMFFAAGDDESDEDDAALPVAGFESLLDMMCAFLEPWPLEWHYRSRDEALIAFSNRHVYQDRLITFPSPGGPPAVSHVLVPQTLGSDLNEESSAAEVRRVVDLVLEHAAERPGESLGVIAMGIKHAQRVEAALDEALKSRSDLDEFFDQTLSERFFVKNLERVQGDERDAIILTIGYGKDRTGRLLYRFGPLLTEGGERRLNVAVTRARRRMTLVSAFGHHDIDLGRSNARGIHLLQRYLEYAATNGRILGDTGSSGAPLNAFEADVFDALTAKGIDLLPQWGVSRYRIDLVARHPHEPGRYVLAIECDGASYHSAPTARERDRLRQEHLQALGWRFHRIWSTDWFQRREQEIARTLAAYKAAVAYTDGADRDRDRTQGPKQPDGVPTAKMTPRSARSPRPSVPPGLSITEYDQNDLQALVLWIQSDRRLRTDEEIIDEVMHELGFSRRGARIETALRRAIAASRVHPSDLPPTTDSVIMRVLRGSHRSGTK